MSAVIPVSGTQSPEYEAIRSAYMKLTGVLSQDPLGARGHLLHNNLIPQHGNTDAFSMIDSVLNHVKFNATNFYKFMEVLHNLSNTDGVRKSIHETFIDTIKRHTSSERFAPANITSNTAFLTSSKSCSTFAERFYEHLNRHGCNAWMEAKDLQSGTSITVTIYKTLDSCTAVVPIMTKEYARTLSCVRELYYAIFRESVRIFPVCIEDGWEKEIAGGWLKKVLTDVITDNTFDPSDETKMEEAALKIAKVIGKPAETEPAETEGPSGEQPNSPGTSPQVINHPTDPLPPKRHVPSGEQAGEVGRFGIWNMTEVHGEGAKGKGIVIAILDGGIDKNDVSFKGKKIGDLKDSDIDCKHFLPQSKEWCDDDEAADPHTTAVAAIAHYVAPEAKLLILRICQGREPVYLLQALEYLKSLEKPVDVICIPSVMELSTKEMRECLSDLAKKTLIVGSVGNYGAIQEYVQFPARDGSVLAVGVLDQYGYISRLNPSDKKAIDVYALGENITLPGHELEEPIHGTSFAAPMVAGLVAILIKLVKDEFGPKHKYVHYFHEIDFMNSLFGLSAVCDLSEDHRHKLKNPAGFILSLKRKEIAIKNLVHRCGYQQ